MSRDRDCELENYRNLVLGYDFICISKMGEFLSFTQELLASQVPVFTSQENVHREWEELGSGPRLCERAVFCVILRHGQLWPANLAPLLRLQCQDFLWPPARWREA